MDFEHCESTDSKNGGFTFVATPIGNLNDLSARAEKVLQNSPIWLVEDSRVSAKLAQVLGIKPTMYPLNEQTAPRLIEKYLALAKGGQNIAVVSDGGSPSISDPGAYLCDQAHLQNLSINAIPGPSAVITALTLSGFYAQQFVFLGFLGRKQAAIRSDLISYQNSSMTLVFFESPYRLESSLQTAGEALPGRRFAICRELTKAFQQVWRGTLPDLPSEEECPRKGEFTVVIEGKRSKRTVSF